MKRVILTLTSLIAAAVLVWQTSDDLLVAAEATPSTEPLRTATPAAPAAPIASAPVAAASAVERWTPPDIVYANRLAYKADAFKGADLPDRLSAMSLRRGGLVFDPKEVADALQSDVAWQEDRTIADRMGLSEEDRKDGREFVRVNPLRIEALMPGDELSLPVKAANADKALRMLVEQVEQWDGVVTWNGRLKDFPSQNQVTFTRGENLIVGGITTPTGLYVVHLVDDIGWVVNGATLIKGPFEPPELPTMER